MAATLFARMEGATLDGTHDFSAGDTTWTLNGGSAAFDATQVKVGTNSFNATAGSDRYAQLDAASIVSSTEGAFGFWIRFSSLNEFTRYMVAHGTSENDSVAIRVTNTNELELRYAINGEGQVTVTTTGADLAIDTWYGVVGRYFKSGTNHDVRLEVYNASSVLIEGVETLGSFLNGAHADMLALKVGTLDGSGRCYIDNVIWANDYDEPIQEKLALSSYTQYTSGSPYTLTAEQGTYSLTGQVSVVHRKMAAAQGSYSLTGRDATLTYVPVGSTYTLTAEFGTYSIAGSAALVDSEIRAEQGSYGITGFAANLGKGYRLTAETGSYVMGGQSAGLIWSGAPAPVHAPLKAVRRYYGFRLSR